VLPTKQQRCCEQCYTFLAVTPEGECAYVLSVRLKEARPNRARRDIQYESSDSDGEIDDEEEDDKEAFTTSSSLGKSPNVPVQTRPRPGSRSPLPKTTATRNENPRPRRNTKNPQPMQNDMSLNAQLFVNVIEASFPPISEDFKGMYCAVILGNQKENTSLSHKDNSSAFWKEGFFFDVTRPESNCVFHYTQRHRIKEIF